ncbi:transmembrane 7 superfamily member 3-like [Anopheles moucheti]|uniref:transmembrane 7 superfamily member 3-like n=1 Tax=Anopheles moucheti TaxID=186751 RepID=UPI0022F0142F|nr:transmembrane 7 superfamily member 3-like [Anopheles moucheti]
MLPCFGARFFVLFNYLFALSTCYASIPASNNASENISTTELPSMELAQEVIELTVPVALKPNDINDYREIVLQPYSNTRIHIANYSRNAGNSTGYALVQLNAFEYNVTLSYNSSIVDGGHLTGLNVGLLMYGDGDLYAFNLNPLQAVWVSLVLMLYNTSAPIPGGCNLEFPVEISPILNLTLTPETIIVDTPTASVAKPFQGSPNGCGKARLEYESFYYIMPSHDFSQRAYFSAIRNVISYANAKHSGQQNTLHDPLLPNRHKYGRLNGQGMVFVTAVIDPVHRGFALYVPTHTYSCKPFLDLAGCYGLNIPLRLLAIVLTIIAVLEVIMGWLPILVKCPATVGCMGMLAAVESMNMLDKPLSQEWIISCLVGGAITGAAIGLLLGIYAPNAGKVFCSFMTGYLICLTLFGVTNGNFYVLPNVSWYVALGGIVIGAILNLTLPIILITRSVIFGTIFIFYGINVIVGARLDYPLRHFVRRLYVENYERVYSDPALDENDFVALAAFAFTMTVTLFLRSRYQSDEVQGDYSRIAIPCHSSPANGDDEDRIERSTVIAADDTAAYQRFFNEQPIITRWTNGDDDVFESPESNSRFYRLLRRNARR